MPRRLSRFRRLKRTYTARQKRHVRRARKLARQPVFTVPAATFLGLFAVSVAAFLLLSGGRPTLHPSDSHIVIVTHDGHQQTVPTSASTVGELLNRLHIQMNQGDVVEPGRTTQIVQDNFRVNVYRAVPVEIVDGDQRTFTYSAAATPRSIVKQAGVQVYPEDDLSLLPTQNFITEDAVGERVVINRATPVNVNLYGTPVAMRTHAATVAGLLKEKNIRLGKNDSVVPAPAAPITAGAQVFVIRKGTQIKTVEQDIPMPVQTIEDDSLTFGTSVVRQQGSPGKQLITYQVQLQNGREVSQQQIQSVVSVQPVTQIVAQGKAVQIPSDKQAVMALAGISSGDYPYVDYIVSHESGWCPTKLQGQYGGCPPYPPASIPAGLGYGLGQATPGSKMAPFGSDWEVSAVTQLRWATSYAQRYGGWAGAYAHWQANHNW